ncbi:MAG: G-D-S-L family lipolytic protein [Chitinophagaceae bacterium]|nr:MAG: G-D-S-L family lipolytic protein [Chitinophagaceae bacterium]
MKLILLLVLFQQTYAQQKKDAPYTKEINEFRAIDSANFPGSNQILLIGSSSFTIWKDVQDYFPGYPIINRAFGGSTLKDQIRWVKEVVYPYNPKQILVYCGENDLAASDTLTAASVIGRFQTLYSLIRKKYPKVPIYFVSLKPSPSRALLLDKMIAVNAGVKAFLAKQKNTGFIDVYSQMIDDEGKPKPELFRDDNLHMKKEGYLIWQRVIAPYLIK